MLFSTQFRRSLGGKQKKAELCKWLDTGIFHSVHWGINPLPSKTPTPSFLSSPLLNRQTVQALLFRKSPLHIGFKYLICVSVKHWILNCPKAWLKTRRKELPGHPLLILGNSNCVNLSFYLNHCYTHIPKQILKYIFCLNKYMESWNAVLINQLSVDYDNFSAVNNLIIIFCTKLTKIWFCIIMIQAITCLTYLFTVANTGKRKPFHQSCICSKTMQQISLKGHRLVMEFMESMVLNPFIKYSGHCKEHTAQCHQPRYVCRVC